MITCLVLRHSAMNGLITQNGNEHEHMESTQLYVPLSTAWWWYHTTTCRSEYYNMIDLLLPQSQTVDQTSEWQRDRFFPPEAILLSD